MAENGHYWQIEGESATAENIDIVLLEIKSQIKNAHIPTINESYKDFIKDAYAKSRCCKVRAWNWRRERTF